MAYSTAEYPIGGGIVYIGPFVGTTPPDDGDWDATVAGGFTVDYGDFVDLGAVPDVSVSIVADIVEHYQIRQGIEGLDAQDVTKVGETWKFTCDQINKDTLAMFFLGTSTATVVSHLTAPTQEFGLKVVPNYTRGQKWIHEAWRGMLKPTGDFKLFTGKEYGKVDFEFTLLNDVTNHPTGSPWGKSTLPTP